MLCRVCSSVPSAGLNTAAARFSHKTDVGFCSTASVASRTEALGSTLFLGRIHRGANSHPIARPLTRYAPLAITVKYSDFRDLAAYMDG